MQRTAAALSSWDDHLAAIALQYAHGSLNQPRECYVGHTSGEKGHPILALARRWKRLANLRKEKGCLSFWCERLNLPQFAETLENPAGPQEPLQAGRLIAV